MIHVESCSYLKICPIIRQGKDPCFHRKLDSHLETLSLYHVAYVFILDTPRFCHGLFHAENFGLTIKLGETFRSFSLVMIS